MSLISPACAEEAAGKGRADSIIEFSIARSQSSELIFSSRALRLVSFEPYDAEYQARTAQRRDTILAPLTLTPPPKGDRA
jgi:hypothetical protein